MNKFQIPKESFNNLKKPNKLLLISFLTVLITSCVTIFGFNSLDLKFKLILFLSIFSLILIIDVIVLYVQYYMYYYQTEYLNKVYSLIDININNLSESISKLKDESIEVKNSVAENNKDIQSLKAKIL